MWSLECRFIQITRTYSQNIFIKILFYEIMNNERFGLVFSAPRTMLAIGDLLAVASADSHS